MTIIICKMIKHVRAAEAPQNRWTTNDFENVSYLIFRVMKTTDSNAGIVLVSMAAANAGRFPGLGQGGFRLGIR